MPDGEKRRAQRKRENRNLIVNFIFLGLVLLALGGFYVVRAAFRVPATPVRAVAGGDPDLGRQAFIHYGCTACHVLDGIRQARGQVGPPLTGLAARSYIAGRLPNTPDNLMAWIMNPQAFNPGTAMPNLSVDAFNARHLAAYIYNTRDAVTRRGILNR